MKESLHIFFYLSFLSSLSLSYPNSLDEAAVSDIFNKELRPIVDTTTELLSLTEGMKVITIDPSQGSTDQLAYAKQVGASGLFVQVQLQNDLTELAISQAKEAGVSEQFRAVHHSLEPGKPLPFEDDVFDAAYSYRAIFRGVEMDYALNELTRVLKPGGKLVIVCPEYSSLESNAIMQKDQILFQVFVKEWRIMKIGDVVQDISGVFQRLMLDNVETRMFTHSGTDLFGSHQNEVLTIIDQVLREKLSTALADERISFLNEKLDSGEFSFSLNFLILSGQKPQNWVSDLDEESSQQPSDKQSAQMKQKESLKDSSSKKANKQVNTEGRKPQVGGNEKGEGRKESEEMGKKRSSNEREAYLAEMREKRRQNKSKTDVRRQTSKRKKKDVGEDDWTPEALEKQYRDNQLKDEF